MVKTQKYLSKVEESIEWEKKTYSIKKEIRQKEYSREGKITNFQVSFNWVKTANRNERERERESKPPTGRASHHKNYFFPQS